LRDDINPELTPREREVYLLVVEEAMTYKDIARRLGIGLETVRRHLANVKDKTGMTTCLELAVRHYCKKRETVSQWGKEYGDARMVAPYCAPSHMN
jgi:DNA-binding CsgD family transcriptional regulator